MSYEKCDNCNEYFGVSEHVLQMPGTKEREPIICPYCKHTNREQMSNGWWDTHRLSDEKRKELRDSDN